MAFATIRVEYVSEPFRLKREGQKRYTKIQPDAFLIIYKPDFSDGRFGGTAVQVQVYDSYGTVVHTARHSLRTGNGTLDLDRLALRQGLSLVTVHSSAGETKTIRLYKK